MPPTAQHEALHRIFQRDEALFARAVARVFNVMVSAPIDVTVLGTDLTETEPMERRPDSVLQAEFIAEFTETGLGDTSGRQIWRALMATRTYPFVSQLRLQGRD